MAAATRENVSPSVVLELLRRIGGVIRDYCGVLSEEAVRKNCVLVYELLDEVSFVSEWISFRVMCRPMHHFTVRSWTRRGSQLPRASDRRGSVLLTSGRTEADCNELLELISWRLG